MRKVLITDIEIEAYANKIRSLSNSARFNEAYNLASRLTKEYPQVLKFSYYEAVMTAEDTTGLSEREANRRFKMATEKFRALLRKLNGQPDNIRGAMRNEYYWFSKQPYKQYRLGVERVKKGDKRAYYCIGVGAAMIAKKYAIEGRKKLMIKWAIRSEKAWTKFYKVDPTWFNGYFFFAMAYGFQGRFSEMENAFKSISRLSGKPLGWKAIKNHRKEIIEIASNFYER